MFRLAFSLPQKQQQAHHPLVSSPTRKQPTSAQKRTTATRKITILKRGQTLTSEDTSMAEFKPSKSTELPVSRQESLLLTDDRTKRQKDEPNHRKEYGSSSPRATPHKNRRRDRRKKDTAGAILNSELDAMHYIANQPRGRVGESSDSDALASSPPIHKEHGMNVSLSSLVNSSSSSLPTTATRATHTNSNSHKAVVLKQNGGNKSTIKTSRPNLQIVENSNKSATSRRNNGKSAYMYENRSASTSILSTSVPEGNGGLMRSPLTNPTSMLQLGTATPSKQQRRRELYTTPGVAQCEPAYSDCSPFTHRRRRSVSSVEDYTHDLSMTSPGRPKSQLYAGPTFHNSPAPSSLPVPAFMQIREQK